MGAGCGHSPGGFSPDERLRAGPGGGPSLCGPPPLPTHTLWTPPSRSPWDPLKDIAQFEQDGVLHTLQRETMAGQTAFLGSPGPRHQVRTTPGPAWAPPPPPHTQLTWPSSSGSPSHSDPHTSQQGLPWCPPGSLFPTQQGAKTPGLAGHAVPGTPRCSGHCAGVHWPCPIAPQNRPPWCRPGGIPLYR